MQKLVFRNGAGNEIDLTAGNFGITNWAGLSNTPLNIQTQQVPFEDGGVFLDALMEQREIDVTVAINDNNDLELRYQLKRELISALNPKLGEGVLIYTNDYLSRQIHAVPQIPLFENKNSNDKGTLKASVTFSCPSPYWEDLKDTQITFKIGQQPIVNNEGDVPTQIKMEWLTNSVTNPMVTNITQKQKIKYNGELNSCLLINTNLGEKSVMAEAIRTRLIQTGEDFINIRCLNGVRFIFGIYSLFIYTDGKMHQIELESGVSPEDIAFSENLGLWVLVCSEGKIYTSTNLETWTARTSGVPYQLECICYSKGLALFVAVGEMGTIITSSDGITWFARTSGINNYLKSIVYSETVHLFIIVGSNACLRSGDGISWTSEILSYNLNEIITDAEGYYIACGDNGAVVSSIDGVSWTPKISGTTTELISITFSREIGFVAIGESITLNSVDGDNWKSKQVENEYLRKVEFDPDSTTFLAVGDDGLVLESYDGEEWRVIFKGENVYQECCVYADKLGLFVIGGDEGVLLCKNGKEGKYIEFDFDFEMIGLCYSEEKGLFVGVGNSGKVVTSTDAEHWELQDVGTSYLYDVIYSAEKRIFIAVGDGGAICVSSDGLSWQVIEDESSALLNVVTYADGQFVIGGDGIYLYSSDGDSWNSVEVTGHNITGITYSKENALFVAVTDSGELIKIQSANMTFWLVTEIATENLRCIRYFENYGIYIAIGENETILTSYDGLDYEEIFKGSNLKFNDIGYLPELDSFIIVGESGVIFGLSYESKENRISSLSFDSDMGMNLAIGENQFKINKDADNMIVRITYRQKYIGV
jgi:predicted phage tail component-like protein